MANWSNPQLTSTYTNFVTEVKDRDVDLALQFDGTTTSNLPTGAIRWNSSVNRWQKWSGSAWGELTSTYALTGLSTTGNASIGGTLSVTGSTTLAAATATTPATADNSTAVATTAWVRAQGYATGAGGSFLPLTGGTVTGALTVQGGLTSSGATVLADVNGGQLAGLRNRIINGDMAIDQRNNGGLINPVTAGNYTLDRWVYAQVGSMSVRVQRNLNSFTPPTGFTNYLGVQTNSAYTVASSDNCSIQYRVEGNSIADFEYGSASRTRTATLSFWVRSSATGTFGGSIRNNANDRSYPFSYTISSANSWEYKTVVIPGDTTGTWLKDNGVGMRISFSLGSGSTFSGTAGSWAAGNLISVTGAVSVLGSVGGNWNITGVQLELGSQATPFEQLPFETELALCQRYYEKSYELETVPGTSANPGSHWFPSFGNTANVFSSVNFKVTKRASPSVSVWDLIGNANCASWANSAATVGHTVAQSVPVQYVGNSGIVFRQSNGISTAVTAGYHWAASAEL